MIISGFFILVPNVVPKTSMVIDNEAFEIKNKKLNKVNA